MTELLAEVGYDGVTFELVARRAGASKPTLYRRWSTKRHMVVAAIRAMPAAGGGRTIDTGSLRGDLLELVRILAETLASSDTALVATLLQAGLADPELCDHLETTTGPTGARLPADVTQRAALRGELAVGADPFPYDEVAGSAMITRALNGLPYGEDYRQQLIDSVILPALRASTSPVHYAGIFSGRIH
ncbi:TetR/AcrR family transcriptional regulator [Arthrobacter sp. AZCC_0090]|uniref:TetR/AcrR family transcriptional regulator n=1 Tax=Arthrobacter sp. AZCC_0090 TaxID=2735881 RepID=UPI0017E1B93A|nr:TetR/AcrR family transcriptional regulator [Arthrobacter sp. AZCC_0090]MBB6405184.1 AcrR family transcriptional regulator [Arthrobacter sp. AZCC_0090]